MNGAIFAPLLRGLILLWLLLLLYGFVLHLIRMIQLRWGWGWLAVTGVAWLISFVLLQLPFNNTDSPALPAVLPTLALLTALAVFLQMYIQTWRKRHISPGSVKESLDSLPTGLCYYWPGGLVKLANVKMDSLCRALTGAALTDGAVFWAALTEGELPGCILRGEQPILQTPEGAAFSFSRNTVLLEGHPLYELIAADVTEEYRLSLELSEKQTQAGYLNARLKALSTSIKFMAMDKEALETKVHIHDSLGSALLMAKRYLLQPGDVDRNELLRMWNTNVTLLRAEGPELWQVPYFTSREQAAALGVELRVDGALPGASHLRPVIDTAITVHATNVLRHARGSRAAASVSEDENSFILTFTNDGDPPAGEIRETGGLHNLRREVEHAGGRMEVKHTPQFQLVLILPKEENGNALQRADR